MTFYTYKPVAMGPGENIFYRTDNTSALNTFAAAGMYGRAARARSRFRRRVPGVTDINATLIAFGPLAKEDSEGLVIQSQVDGDFNLIKSSGEISEAERRIALANSVAGAIAGPAAIFGAIKTAKAGTGGMPRSTARKALSKVKVKDDSRTARVKQAAERAVQALDKPMSTKAKIAAGAAGAGLVGVQVAGLAGDTITSRAMAGAERAKREN